MATSAQIDANRANAQLSTGPVTPEGKARVGRNALKHGLTSQRPIVRDDEEGDFAALRDSLTAEIQPETALEAVAFEELLHAAWNLRRFRRLEAEATNGALDDLKNPDTAALLDRLGRYHARAQRSYSRALSELRGLQTTRGLRSASMGDELAATVPILADIERLTKQSQWQLTFRHPAPPPMPPQYAPNPFQSLKTEPRTSVSGGLRS